VLVDQELVTALIGSRLESDFTQYFIRRHNLSDLMDDPPGRIYIGSERMGMDLLFEESVLISLQINLVDNEESRAFKGNLPFGIFAGMKMDEVHSLVGIPFEFDEFDSKFSVFDQKIKMVVMYGDSLDVERIQFEPMKS
jgi:hypothetical protein